MKQMKKIIIIILITAAGSLQVWSQENINEFSIHGGGGISTLIYQLSSGDRNIGLGGDIGLGYSFIRSREQITSTGRIYRKNWGFHTGLSIGMYHSKAKLNQQKLVTEDQCDYDGDLFDLITSFTKYVETQSVLTLNIPVMAQFHYRQFYVSGGFKMAIPLNTKFSAKDVALTNEAYYYRYKNWAKTQEFAGYGPFRNKDYKGELDFGTSVLLALEGGTKWRLSSKLSLYTGFYFDYGLSNAYKGSPKWFIKYDQYDPEYFSTNSVLSLTADPVRLISAGITMRLALEK